MTKQEFEQQIKEADRKLPTLSRLCGESTRGMAELGVQYAISVLEELADGYQIMTEDGVNGIPTGSVTGKIKELKALLK